MINKLSHGTIYVSDQDEALEFYTEKLGFEVRMDMNMDGFRWLTIGTSAQPDLELVLMKPTAGPMFPGKSAEQIAELQKAGALGVGVLQTDDCKKTYEELKAKGVEFVSPPEERPYGIEAVLKDNSGNWFSLTQPRAFGG